MSDNTDWKKYYENPGRISSVTRSFSNKELLTKFSTYIKKPSYKVCEIGGANSCFIKFLCKNLPISKYHIIDLESYGLSLLNNIQVNSKLTWEKKDILDDDHRNFEKFDVVFSVGLIEHFSTKDTAIAIENHFKKCAPEGLVILTFPTPTPLYRFLRKIIEVFGLWRFPDERPLQTQEVLDVAVKYGTVINQSILWKIGLTQGYVVLKKTPT